VLDYYLGNKIVGESPKRRFSYSSTPKCSQLPIQPCFFSSHVEGLYGCRNIVQNIRDLSHAWGIGLSTSHKMEENESGTCGLPKVQNACHGTTMFVVNSVRTWIQNSCIYSLPNFKELREKLGEFNPSYILHTRAFGTYLLGGGGYLPCRKKL
jgi:hypothetical protein